MPPLVRVALRDPLQWSVAPQSQPALQVGDAGVLLMRELDSNLLAVFVSVTMLPPSCCCCYCCWGMVQYLWELEHSFQQRAALNFAFIVGDGDLQVQRTDDAGLGPKGHAVGRACECPCCGCCARDAALKGRSTSIRRQVHEGLLQVVPVAEEWVRGRA